MKNEPQLLKSTPKEILDLHERLGQKQLSDADIELLQSALHTILVLMNAVQHKTQSIKTLLRRIFGPTSEKSSDLFQAETENPPLTEATEQKTDDQGSGEQDPPPGKADRRKKRKRTKPKPKGHGRRKAEEYTGSQKQRVENPQLQAGQKCPACDVGRLYPLPDGKLLTLDASMPITATLFECERLRCNACSVIFTASPPGHVASHKYTPKVGNMIAFFKYAAGLPFHRLEVLQQMVGVPISASVQHEQVKQAANYYWPVLSALQQYGAQGQIFHNDDTMMRILEVIRENQQDRPVSDPADDKQPKRSVFTTGILAVNGKHKVALFHTDTRHAGENLADLLKHRDCLEPPPIQMCDALSRNIPKDHDLKVAHCLVHARRQFVDILESFPQQCQHVIDLIGRVYKNEEEALESKLTPEQRLIFHQQRSGPAMEELHQWASKQFDQRLVEPNSVLGKAITYLQRHWEPLTLFLRQPGAPIDNNACERALKKAILHRKNSMFYKTRIGARLGDLFMSIFYTCQLNKINPLHYMNTVCEHHAEVVDNPEQWLPWNYQQAVSAIS